MSQPISDASSFRRRLFVVTGAGTALVLFAIAWSISRGRPENKPSTTRVLPVLAMAAERSNSYQAVRHFTGQVRARRVSDLAFELPGRLMVIEVDDGQRVQEGTVLARIDDRKLNARKRQLVAGRAAESARLAEMVAGSRETTIDAIRADVERLDAAYERTMIRAARIRAMDQKGATSRDELQEAVLEEKGAYAHLNAARSRLTELIEGTREEQILAQRATVEAFDAKVAAIDLEIAESVILAPYDGTIDRIHVDEYTTVSAGLPIVTIVDQQSMEVWVGVATDALASLNVGSTHDVAIGDRVLPATVKAVLPLLNVDTRTAQIVLSLDQAQGLEIRPGEVARLRLERTIHDTGSWVPISALVKSQRGLWSVYTLDTDAQDTSTMEATFEVRMAHVDVLHAETDRVYVRGPLPDETMIVTAGIDRIVNGQLVRPIVNERKSFAGDQSRF